MSACNATTRARYSVATAYLSGHILHRALNVTGTPDEAHSVLDAATGDVLEYRHLYQGPEKNDLDDQPRQRSRQAGTGCRYPHAYRH